MAKFSQNDYDRVDQFMKTLIPEIKIGHILTQFMRNLGINDQSLADKTGIPLPTIARLRRGKDVNPTATTLLPLAKFFNITVGQLLGDEILISSPVQATNRNIPLLSWEQVDAWLNTPGMTQQNIDWVATQNTSAKSFALIVNTNNQNVLFQKGTLLIIDPTITPIDGDFILSKEEDSQHLTIKQLLVDGKDLYIKSTNPEINSLRLLKPNDAVIGVIVEVRHAFKKTF